MELEGELLEIYRTAQKKPLLSAAEVGGTTILDRQSIEGILPHRDPFLFLDRVTMLNLERAVIAGSYRLSKDNYILAGHFPGNPYWPGVTQIEMIAQAACLLHIKISESEVGRINPLTRILAARFIQKVEPEEEIQVIARWLDDGLFFVTVGQCLQNGRICSIAALQGLK